MIDVSTIDYSELDQPEVLAFLFHPRPDPGMPSGGDHVQDLMIPVHGGDRVGARLHLSGRADPMILFFHGNGEIVADYDDIGILYNRMNINFLPVDYRGYGRSTGTPTITSMMQDSHSAFAFVLHRRRTDALSGPLVVMGRSLGSAPALELAAHYPGEIDGLIIESGFADLTGLYDRLGISAGIPEEKRKALSNVGKIAAYKKPSLVIHAEHDHIIPFSAGRALYEAAGAPDKTLLKIPGANHNDIFFRGREMYFTAVADLVSRI